MFLILGTLLSALIAIFVGIGAYRKRPDPLALPLVALMTAVVAWSIPHAIGKLIPELSWVLLWESIQYPGIVAAPLCYLIVAHRYAGYRHYLTKRVIALLAIVPVLTVIVVWTNEIHGLFWTSAEVETIFGAAVMVTEEGPYFYLNLGYLYLLTATGVLILGHALISRDAAYRKEATLMFLAGLLPLGFNVLFNAGWFVNPHLDPTPVALSFSGLLIGLALFRFNLIDVSKLAKQDLVDQLEDGVIVVNSDDTVKEYNQTAGMIFDELESGEPIERYVDPDVLVDGGMITFETDVGANRYFQPRISPIESDRGSHIGRLVYLTDVTKLFQREQRLSVLNRILRHNVRNELTVTLGNLTLLEEQLDQEGINRLEEARSSINKVLDHSEKARLLEDRITDQASFEEIELTEMVESIVDKWQSTHPTATIEYGSNMEGQDLEVRTIDSKLFERAITEVIENAIVHNDADTPSVSITISETVETAEIHIRDNGPGIPAIEREVLESVEESALEHGSGLGLWFVHWTVMMSNGELLFGSKPHDGGHVVVTLQKAS